MKMICPDLTTKRYAETNRDYPYCSAFDAFTNSDFCSTCMATPEGREQTRELFARRDGKKNQSLLSKINKAAKRKILKAGSEALGRALGGQKVDPETVAKRKAICHACDTFELTDGDPTCGELITKDLRLSKEARQKRGCGCYLRPKWNRKKFSCPRGLWPSITDTRKDPEPHTKGE